MHYPTQIMDLTVYETLADDVYGYIEQTCIDEMGVYRVPGSNDEAISVYQQYLAGQRVDLAATLKDPMTATTLLKYAMTHATAQLIPDSLYPVFRSALYIKEQTGKVPARVLRRGLLLIPEKNRTILTKFVRHLKTVSEHKDKNQMGMINLLIVFGPSMLHAYNEDPLEEMRANPAILKMLFDEIVAANQM